MIALIVLEGKSAYVYHCSCYCWWYDLFVNDLFVSLLRECLERIMVVVSAWLYLISEVVMYVFFCFFGHFG